MILTYLPFGMNWFILKNYFLYCFETIGLSFIDITFIDLLVSCRDSFELVKQRHRVAKKEALVH